VRFRAVTYNVHKCRGLDRRTAPGRIADVLRSVEADVIALQEVLSVGGSSAERDQAHYLAAQLDMHLALGAVRELGGGLYGNVILSRFPITDRRLSDLTVRNREERGCLRADLALPGALLHVFNVHLGTSFLERRDQARMLLGAEALEYEGRAGPRLVMGDFNEWTAGLATKLLQSRFHSLDVRERLLKTRTYPGVLPFLHLDHVYHDPQLRVVSARLHRTKVALVASDHLPLSVDFEFSAGQIP
jgi:endonuclease/exonuclease/phosphatase family metal-dependent hydrolase